MHSINNSQMYVIKRNGEKEKVMFDKITLRISKLINDHEIGLTKTLTEVSVKRLI